MLINNKMKIDKLIFIIVFSKKIKKINIIKILKNIVMRSKISSIYFF